MTQEDKELLLRDLCARLPYGVKCQYTCVIPEEKIGRWNCIGKLKGIVPLSNGHIGFMVDCDKVDAFEGDIKPYLRPMSSMTEEEKEELKSKCTHTETEEDWEGVRCDSWGIQILDKYDTRRWDNPIWPSTINMDAIDWLNSHHFDYRGLIDKGFAIAVTEDNNPYKE